MLCCNAMRDVASNPHSATYITDKFLDWREESFWVFTHADWSLDRFWIHIDSTLKKLIQPNQLQWHSFKFLSQAHRLPYHTLLKTWLCSVKQRTTLSCYSLLHPRFAQGLCSTKSFCRISMDQPANKIFGLGTQKWVFLHHYFYMFFHSHDLTKQISSRCLILNLHWVKRMLSCQQHEQDDSCTPQVNFLSRREYNLKFG